MATVAQLQDTARDLGLSFTTKTRKSELEALIATELDRRAEDQNRAFVEANSKPIPHYVALRLGLAQRTAPRNVPLTPEARAENYRRTNDGSAKLTGKQAKRLQKKTNKYFA